MTLCTLLLVFPDDRTAQISVGFNSATAQYVEISGSGGMLRIEIAWNNENRSVDLEHRTPDGTEFINFELDPSIHESACPLV